MTSNRLSRLERLLPVLLLPILPVSAQSPAPAAAAVVSFHYEHAGLPVHEDGSGTYAATYAPPPPDPRYGSSVVNQSSAPTQVSRTVSLSSQTTAKLFERVRSTGRFHAGCESKARNIANTGAKTISYTGPDGAGNCTFNYAEDKAIVALTETFQSIAQTLDEGRSIDLKHRYDRLALDSELSNLAEQVHAGRAIELATIAPVLQSLCDDAQVMERVRRRAAGLLEASQVGR
jgi:hypothetical protein